MSGLLIKDFVSIRKKYGILRPVMDAAIAAVLMILMESNGAIIVALLLVPLEIMSLVLTLFSSDEEWKWNRYAIALPVTKREIVRNRYMFCGISLVVGFLFSLAVNSIAFLAFAQYPYIVYLIIAIMSAAMTALFLALMLPSSYTIGANAGGVVMIVMLVGAVVLGFVIVKSGFDWMSFILNKPGIFVSIVSVLIILLCILSYFISVMVFKKKHT